MIVLAFGVALIYYTYASASDPAMAPPLVPVYYSLGLLLLIAGLMAVIAKFK